MAQALRSHFQKPEAAHNCQKPVDLVHLAKQTMGDSVLETEVLGLFLSQSADYLNEFLAADDWQARKRVAHKIKGCARGLGAWDLAEIAELAEHREFNADGELENAMVQVSDYIRALQN